MTIAEAAKELNKAFKKEMNNTLEDKVEELKNTIAILARKNDELEKIIINLAERIEYLENRCQ